MQEWYSNLDFTQQLFWGCAIVSSVIFLIQMILTLIGIDSDIDVGGADFDGDTTDFGGLSLFSIRSMINFFVGFGWAGVSFHGIIQSVPLLYVVSVVVGIAFGSMWIVMRRKLARLEKNGAYKIEDCVGKTCDVYLRIPARKSGAGKVQVSINGSIHELSAMTEGEQLPTGAKVRVLALINGNTLLVEKD